MHAACMSLEGFPMLSLGDEIGQVNDYRYKENPELAADSRYLHRSPFNWENAALRSSVGIVQHEVWEGLKKMEMRRRENPCFGEEADVTTWDTGSPPGQGQDLRSFALRLSPHKIKSIRIAR